MAHRTREIATLMKANGFVLLRQNRHSVWMHPLLGQVVTPVSPSDGARAVKNISSQIKRLRGKEKS